MIIWYKINMDTKKMFATRINKELLKQLKHLSVDTERSISDLTQEAIKDLIRKHAQDTE